MTDTPKLVGTDTLRIAYPKINQSIDRVNNFKSQIDQMVVEGDSSVEAAQARVKADGTVKTTLKDRLDESDTQLAHTAIDLDSRGLNVKRFGFKGDGVTDDTQSITDAVEYAKQYGLSKVVVPFSKSGLVVSSPIYVREGVSVICDDAPTFRRGNFPYNKVIIAQQFNGEAVFILESHATIDGFVLYDPHQKYSLTSHTENWVEGRPIGIQLGYSGYNAFDGNNVAYGNTIINIGFIGILRGIVQHDQCINVEALTVSNLRGMPLEIGINIKRAFDVLRFENIQWNLNSYAGFFSGDTTHYYRKVANNCVMFKFGRVDDPIINSCFAFGVKHFIHWYRDAFTGDNNSGGGAIIQGSSADVCHVAFQVDRSGLNTFGVRVIGGFFVPVVKMNGSKQALVKFSGVSTFNTFQFIGVRAFGATVPSLGTSEASAPTENHIIWDTTGGNNLVMLVASHLGQYSGELTVGGNPTINNRYSMLGSADNNSLSNVTNMPIFLRAEGNDSPDLVFDPVTGSRINMDSFGNKGAGMLRILVDGIVRWTLNDDTGNFTFGKNGGGVSVKSPDGTKTGVFTVNDVGEPMFGGARLGRRVGVPPTPTSTGSEGQWAQDASFLYVCTAPNTWRRVAIGSW